MADWAGNGWAASHASAEIPSTQGLRDTGRVSGLGFRVYRVQEFGLGSLLH